MAAKPNYIRWFDEVGMDDVPLVGGKNASLGELYRALRPQGIDVPNGFAITADAYRRMVEQAGILPDLHEDLDDLDATDPAALAEAGARARERILGAALPDSLVEEILEAYGKLREEYADDLSLAVRSSATAEDLPTASFAGQHESYLNVRGDAALLDACRHCFASLFTDRAIHYRIDQGFDHFRIALSIGVMKMVRSDLASSGVIFTLDTESGFRDVVFVTGAWGLGENVVKGTIDPDEFYVFKPTLESGHRTVLRRSLGSKELRMVYAAEGAEGGATRNVETTPEERRRFCIDDEEVVRLAEAAVRIERHYGSEAGRPQPMDIEWARDGLDGKLYIVQARPETVASQREAATLETFRLEAGGKVLISGRAVGNRAATGTARVIQDTSQLERFQPGEVLVADTTTPDWEPVMKTAAAIVTNRGGRTCHAAIVARELGIPAVVGAANATAEIPEGEAVTVSCCEGDTGHVYAGAIPIHVERVDLSDPSRPRTAIMVNLGNPDLAFQTSFLPNDGVGLARMEFIISESIRIHPMAAVHPERLTNPADQEALRDAAEGYGDPKQFFVQRLSEGIGTIAAAFFPKPVIVRMSDFKTNEYATLIGGRDFEPEEENPMLGFRGAARYIHPAYAEAFALECEAMLRVRTEMGLDNVVPMIPFCRRVEEARRVVERMAELGLRRGDQGLEIFMMCEIPNNVLQIDEFAHHFDGFSIGSNDLTQLVLGVDRDSPLVAPEFDERDPGVKAMIRMAIDGCRRTGRHSGLCGQAPSDFPEMAEFLVESGIDSLSLNPDSVLSVTRLTLEVEARLEAGSDAPGQRVGASGGGG